MIHRKISVSSRFFVFVFSSHNFRAYCLCFFISSWNLDLSFLSFSFKFSIATRLHVTSKFLWFAKKSTKPLHSIRLLLQAKNYILTKISLPLEKQPRNHSCKYCFVCCLFTFRILLCLPKHAITSLAFDFSSSFCECVCVDEKWQIGSLISLKRLLLLRNFIISFKYLGQQLLILKSAKIKNEQGFGYHGWIFLR